MYSVQYTVYGFQYYAIFVWRKEGHTVFRLSFSSPLCTGGWVLYKRDDHRWEKKGQGKYIVYLKYIKTVYHGIRVKTQRDIAELNSNVWLYVFRYFTYQASKITGDFI